MPPSIAIATPVLGGPGTMRVVLNSSSILEPPPTNGLCNSRLCVGHASVHSDSGSRAWGSGGCARCVEQQQQQHPIWVMFSLQKRDFLLPDPQTASTAPVVVRLAVMAIEPEREIG